MIRDEARSSWRDGTSREHLDREVTSFEQRLDRQRPGQEVAAPATGAYRASSSFQGRGGAGEQSDGGDGRGGDG